MSSPCDGEYNGVDRFVTTLSDEPFMRAFARTVWLIATLRERKRCYDLAVTVQDTNDQPFTQSDALTEIIQGDLKPRKEDHVI